MRVGATVAGCCQRRQLSARCPSLLGDAPSPPAQPPFVQGTRTKRGEQSDPGVNLPGWLAGCLPACLPAWLRAAAHGPHDARGLLPRVVPELRLRLDEALVVFLPLLPVSPAASPARDPTPMLPIMIDLEPPEEGREPE